MWVKIFLSTVSDEFRRYRDVLRSDLTRHNVEVKALEDFTDLGGETLDKLDVYIAHCDAVVHLVGDMTGAYPGERGLSALLTKYPDLPAKLLPLGTALKDGSGLSYTQWEAWLALYHRKLLLIAEAEEAAERERQYPPTDASRTAQDVHLARLSACLKSRRRPITDRNGPLLNPTPAVQLWRREPPNLPHSRHCPSRTWAAQSGGKASFDSIVAKRGSRQGAAVRAGATVGFGRTLKFHTVLRQCGRDCRLLCLAEKVSQGYVPP